MPASETLIGVALGDRYQVEDLLSEEFLGRVYRARDLVNGPLVQVKVFHPHLAGNPEKFARFGRELVASRMVSHPSTVKVLDAGTHDELHFMVMEFLSAHTLADELESGPLTVERAALVAAQIASAIGAAHQESIVHRNLSPANVLILDNVQQGAYVKVRDFGLSRLDDYDDEAPNLTAIGARVGNIHYMAPEYIEANKVHPKGDQYALGALFFQMLTGKTPYEGRAADILTMHVTDPVPKPTAVDPRLPPWTDAVVAALMAKEPADRPGAYAVGTLLEQSIGHTLVPPKLLGIDADGRVVHKSRWPTAVALVGVGVLMAGVFSMALVTAAGVGYWWWSRPPPIAAPIAVIDDGGLSPRAGPVSTPAVLRVRANRAATVYVGDMPMGVTPLELTVAAGTHEVSAHLAGQDGSRQAQVIAVTPGEDRAIEFQW